MNAKIERFSAEYIRPSVLFTEPASSCSAVAGKCMKCVTCEYQMLY